MNRTDKATPGTAGSAKRKKKKTSRTVLFGWPGITEIFLTKYPLLFVKYVKHLN